MKFGISNRIMAALVVGTALVGTGVPAYAQKAQRDPAERAQRKAAKQAAREAQQQKQPREQVQQRQQVEQRQQYQQRQYQQRDTTPQRVVVPQTQIDRQRIRNQQYEQQRQQQIELQRQQQIQLQRQQQVQGRRQQYQAARLSQARQQELIRTQQARINTYNARLAEQQRLAQRQAELLRQQNRLNRYRFQQEYYERLRQQQLALANARYYNYYNDPYFYTAPSYRYGWGGHYYTTNEYGADLLRQAINNGYEEGFEAGRADRQDSWRFDPRDSFAYQDANFGYGGFYVDQSAYNYYFRQGFERGYEDGYYSRYQYGTYNNGRYSVLGAVLSTILNLIPLS